MKPLATCGKDCWSSNVRVAKKFQSFESNFDTFFPVFLLCCICVLNLSVIDIMITPSNVALI